MSLLVVENPLALVALLRGWRAARLLLVTRAQGRLALRRTGSLYQI